MTNLKKCLLLFAIVFSTSVCIQWPEQIKRCRLDDPNLDKCALEAARSAIPHLAKGVKEWGLVPLDPYRNLNITIHNNSPPLNIVFKIINGTIRDATTTYSIQKMRYDKKKNELQFDSFHKRLRTSGNYSLGGQVFAFNVKSNGVFDLDCRDLSHYMSGQFLPSKTRKGFSDLKIVYKMKDVKKCIFNMKDASLNPSIERGIIRVINGNWPTVARLLVPTAEKGLEQVIHQSISPLSKRFKFSEIFPQ